MTTFDLGTVFDAAFAGGRAHMIDQGGRSEPFHVDQWSAPPDWVDHELFIAPCDGPTIDVGCGPGRLVAAFADRRIPAMGIDVSNEAIRQTRVRGALALKRDVFASVPGEGRWAYALLADGNLGIGGDPVRLLTRLADILTPGGTIIAEVAHHGAGVVRDRRRLRVDGRMTEPFAWAVVGLDAIERVAADAGLSLAATRTVGGRHAAILARDAA